jgi:ethanolamine utilization protein EutP (predicted NTPase)
LSDKEIAAKKKALKKVCKSKIYTISAVAKQGTEEVLREMNSVINSVTSSKNDE